MRQRPRLYARLDLPLPSLRAIGRPRAVGRTLARTEHHCSGSSRSLDPPEPGSRDSPEDSKIAVDSRRIGSLASPRLNELLISAVARLATRMSLRWRSIWRLRSPGKGRSRCVLCARLLRISAWHPVGAAPTPPYTWKHASGVWQATSSSVASAASEKGSCRVTRPSRPIQ